MTVEHIMKLADEYVAAKFVYGRDNWVKPRSALLAAVEELAKDAERYRKLRASQCEIRVKTYKKHRWFAAVNPLSSHETDYEESLDAVVDTMKGQS